MPSIHRDLLSAYAASAAKVGSWMVVSALVYRAKGSYGLGLLVLVRSVLSLLNYFLAGIGPATVRQLVVATATPAVVVEPAAAEQPIVLPYARPGTANEPAPPMGEVYSSAIALTFQVAFVALLLVALYAKAAENVHGIRDLELGGLVLLMGAGVLVRLVSDVAGACLIARGRIALDNSLQALAEVLWVVSTVFLFSIAPRSASHLVLVAWGSCLSGFALLVARTAFARRDIGLFRKEWVRRPIVRGLIAYAAWAGIGSLADFLHGPMNNVLIGQLISSRAVADYAPAIQIDSALLLIAGGISAVLFPRAAAACANGDLTQLRRQYVRGTVAALGMLGVAGVAVYLAGPWIFRIWFGTEMPVTQAILPLVLVHTVVGGASSVARSILLAVGKVGPYTISSIVAGVCNVVLGYVLVKFYGLGLRGIVIATVAIVLARCILWMPWYTWRAINQVAEKKA